MSDSETKYAIRMILLTASLGGMSFLSFNNGLLLSYFSHLGISSSTILILLSILPLTTFVIIIPFSYLSDIFGKKLLGMTGMVFSLFGFGILIGVSYLPDSLRILIVGLGIVVFGIGSAMTLGNWFALLHPIIPEKIRGRFFGQLRLTWQSVGIIFTLLVIYILEQNPTLGMYQAILAVIAILMLIRMFFYQQIPELEKNFVKKETFKKSFMKVLTIPGYLSFCAYCFLLTLFTGACPQIFSLIEKDILLLSKVEIVFIGNLLIAGALSGFFLGGRLVDRFGTKYVFLSCHFGFGIILFLFLGRNLFPVEIRFVVGILTIFFGMVQAASSIAMTSETLALIPPKNKSLATGLWFTLYSGGTGLSGILSGQALELGLFSESWIWFGYSMSRYDGLLLLFGSMVLLMTITLGMIPSMINNAPAGWIPQSS
ncbi:MAG: MFS transporter [SAR324 cluster bacterium]|nr:MFS transporter [SAR324 cluster bacterium]MBL7034262.1 MFS transporter [SAR324 cluster bacterium]